jgi:hypothetical protein
LAQDRGEKNMDISNLLKSLNTQALLTYAAPFLASALAKSLRAIADDIEAHPEKLAGLIKPADPQ